MLTQESFTFSIYKSAKGLLGFYKILVQMDVCSGAERL